MKVNAYATSEPKGRLNPFSFELGPLENEEVDVKIHYCGSLSF